MPRPRAGDWLADEIGGWRAEGVDVVASLLEADEVHELGLGLEAAFCRAEGIEFVRFPIRDRGVPYSGCEAAEFTGTLAARVLEGKAVAIHCRAGIGRAALVAGCTLVCLGFAAEDALLMIAAARGVAVPDTEEQRAWVAAFGERFAASSTPPWHPASP